MALKTVAEVNGWNIERDHVGAAYYWFALALCPDGYRIARHEFPSRRAAEAFARATPVPPPPEITPEVAARRARVSAALARLRG